MDEKTALLAEVAEVKAQNKALLKLDGLADVDISDAFFAGWFAAAKYWRAKELHDKPLN